ncbi:hypothetical protein HMF7854_05185 [Sphingomonas ginkgonis]|uniref:Uncharacterized protein n=1 Tax=Sphingomonas ginkgonis TaxID=2315330 RepID=A0A429V8I6_9SPHN|nr:hypothetical protein [Sphingomonas ginkgonis]RST30281.1 hypothetical protein HMF7854_05185 [Sphingomonas ginkgonis]
MAVHNSDRGSFRDWENSLFLLGQSLRDAYGRLGHEAEEDEELPQRRRRWRHDGIVHFPLPEPTENEDETGSE